MIAQVENWESDAEGPLNSAPLATEGLLKSRSSDKPNVAILKKILPSGRRALEERLATMASIRGKVITLFAAVLLVLAVYYVLVR
jgi:hypothetical protein